MANCFNLIGKISCDDTDELTPQQQKDMDKYHKSPEYLKHVKKFEQEKLKDANSNNTPSQGTTWS